MASYLIIALCFGPVETLPTGFFYALERTDGADRLYRIDLDGTTTAIGGPGQLGFPTVIRVVWADGKLYGFDMTFGVWLSINPATGRAHALSEYGGIVGFPEHLTFCPFNQTIYGEDGIGIVSVDRDTGEKSERLWPAGRDGLTCVENAIGRIDGLYTIDSPEGLRLIDVRTSQIYNLGGDARAALSLTWDKATNVLFFLKPASGDATKVKLYIVNQVTGNEELWQEWPSLPFPLLDATYVPPDSLEAPDCAHMDIEPDGDIDLLDFADFQNCMGIPIR